MDGYTLKVLEGIASDLNQVKEYMRLMYEDSNKTKVEPESD